MRPTALLIAATLLGGCTRATAVRATRPPLPEPAIVADSVRIATVAPGVKHRYYWINEGPWAVNVLDVDRMACWSPIPIKGRPSAVGREKTSVLVKAYSDTLRRPFVSDRGRPPNRVVAGGVNGDFFSFTPPGVPVGPHIVHERVLAGPADRDVFAVDSAGKFFIGRLAIRTMLYFAADSVAADVNRLHRNRVSFVDAGFTEQTDSSTGAIELVLHWLRPSNTESPPVARVSRISRWLNTTVADIDTAPAGVTVSGRFVVVAGPHADSTARRRLSSLKIGDTLEVVQSYPDFEPLHAIAGLPALLSRGEITGQTASAGNAGFRQRHPRTAVGFDSAQRRLLLVTVDGRQPGYSVGMTLPEIATLMRRLGATEALNLDGGGSTTFVVADSADHSRFRVANRPSDKEGERPVANALAVQNFCGMWLREHDVHQLLREF